MPLNHTHLPPRVHRSVPFIYVADIDATCAFYALLGFETLEILRDADGRPNWAWAQTKSGGSRSVVAQLMFSRTWRPILPGNQDIFLYMYSLDLPGLRRHLLDAGVRDGGDATAWDLPAGSPRAARTLFAIHHPPYMPAGEFRLHDPDGYCILVGELDEPVHH
ncbi:MAG: hypothetical protein IT434_00550 [Phycisphaerales bacterium]|jgi:hypothetical protein|nr:hypothetical protein [Phycisphaerales bacterium]